MGRPWRTIVAAAVAASAAAGGIGCTHSSRVFPYDEETVWVAARGECLKWRPHRGIDDERHTVKSTLITRDGGEVQRELKLQRELSLPSRPRTRVLVRIAQTKPKKQRFVEEERYFLDDVARVLAEMVRATGGG